MNDIEMMGAAYYSYAMENAFPPVKEAARFVAPSNAEHGVIKTIRGFMEQGLC
jgi:hydroxymethylpyrimidine pyrophosphatase-like HAD family hydrolase